MAYIPNPQHRNAAFASQKSQWVISVSDELVCYQKSQQEQWVCGEAYWGLHLVQLSPSLLGTSQQPSPSPLHIAKFVGDLNGNWHGYPVAHWLSPYDKPAVNVLNSWLESGMINRPKYAKIHRGKKCTL
jgi:hypothetical protein